MIALLLTGCGIFQNRGSGVNSDENAKICWTYLRSMGCSEQAAAAILGNIKQESDFDPGAHEKNGGIGRGICQWSVGERFENLVTFAEDRGQAWDNINVQLEFLWSELSGGNPTTTYLLERDYGGLANFVNTTDIDWATVAFEKSYLRSADWENNPRGVENRLRYAHRYYEMFVGR